MSAPRVAAIPVKAPDRAKSRLAAVLRPAERTRLCRALFRATLASVAACGAVGRIVVVSADAGVLREAAAAGAAALQEAAGEGFNGAARRAAAALPWGAPIAIVPTDLPLLAAADLADALSSPRAIPAVTLAPDRHRDGTNLMVLWPAGVIAFAFGPQSFAAHRRAAEAAGLVPRVIESPSLGFDLDTPEDWDLLRRTRPDLVARLLSGTPSLSA